MKVWIIQVGEPLPIEPGNPRIMRSGMLANALAERGHQVVWWTGAFDHRTKNRIMGIAKRKRISSNLEVVFLRSPGYRKNFSIGRLVDHFFQARCFEKWSRQEPIPDVIHCGYPTIDLSRKAAIYGKRNGVPVIIDVRDLWPDIFVDLFPKYFRAIANMLLAVERRKARQAFCLTTAISGNAPGMMQFGLNYAGREAGHLDRHVLFSYPEISPSSEEIDESMRAWERRGVSLTAGIKTICFFGTFSSLSRVDLITPIRATRLLNEENVSIQLVLCGEGPSYRACKNEIGSMENVFMPGRVGRTDIHTLMQNSSAGILPYFPARDFLLSIPNKVAEYLCGSLPILTSVKGGYLQELLDKSDCALYYDWEDANDLAEKIKALISDPLRTSARRKDSRGLFDEHFSAEKTTNKLILYLEEAASSIE